MGPTLRLLTDMTLNALIGKHDAPAMPHTTLSFQQHNSRSCSRPYQPRACFVGELENQAQKKSTSDINIHDEKRTETTTPAQRIVSVGVAFRVFV